MAKSKLKEKRIKAKKRLRREMGEDREEGDDGPVQMVLGSPSDSGEDDGGRRSNGE